MNDEKILKLNYIILIILVISALYYSVELIPSLFDGGGNVIMQSGNITFTPEIFVEHMLSVTIIDTLVAILAILALRNAIRLNKKTHDSQGQDKSL